MLTSHPRRSTCPNEFHFCTAVSWVWVNNIPLKLQRLLRKGNNWTNQSIRRIRMIQMIRVISIVVLRRELVATSTTSMMKSIAGDASGDDVRVWRVESGSFSRRVLSVCVVRVEQSLKNLVSTVSYFISLYVVCLPSRKVYFCPRRTLPISKPHACFRFFWQFPRQSLIRHYL